MSGYLLAMAVVTPATGWAVDRFGARRMWIGSVLAFGEVREAVGQHLLLRTRRTPAFEQVGEVRRLGHDEADHGVAVGRLGHTGREGAAEGDERRFQVGRVGGQGGVEERAEVDFVARLGPRDHVEEQALLVAVVVVHRALGDARFPGDRVDAGAGVAVAEEQRERGSLDRRPLGGRTFPDHGAILHCTV